MKKPNEKKRFTYSAFRVAKRIAIQADWALPHTDIQQLLYICHMFSLGRHDKALVYGRFQAWKYGPVHPDLYHYLKVFGADPVDGYFYEYKQIKESPQAELVDELVEMLGNSEPGRLMAITHRRGGAWEKNYNPDEKAVIPNEDLKQEYQDRVNEAKSRRENQQ